MDPTLLMSLMGGGGGMSPWGTATGIGLSLLGGGLAKRRARKEKHSLSKRINKSIGLTEALGGRGLSQQEAATRKATGETLGGYDAARREVERLGGASRQSVLDREQQLGAGLSQGLASRGLGSTTMGANLSRGLASDTNRQLQGINEGLAPEYANLALGRGQAQAAGTQRLGDLAAQRGQFQSQLGQMRLLGGQQLGQISAPLNSGPGMLEMALPGIGSALGQSQMFNQQPQMDPRMLQWLFGGRPGSMGYGGGSGMNMNTFDQGQEY